MIRLLPSVMILGWATVARAEPQVVVVRTAFPLVSCVSAAARSYSRAIVDVQTQGGGDADVLVLGERELTRALESAQAAPRSEVDIARLPWVVASAKATGSVAADGLAAAAPRVAVPSGPAASEARRWLESVHARLLEVDDLDVLRDAPTALVPAALAHGTRSVPAPAVPPLVVRGALSAGRASGAARAFLKWLSGAAGQRAFAACGASAP
jgi:hypothetical protein